MKIVKPLKNRYASITPETVSATLRPSKSLTENKIVFLPAAIPKADVVFAFDLTGSMYDDIGVAKSQAINIMTALDTLISDAQYGVISFMDYPGYYSSYGYSDYYGDASWGDYAYRLDQGITDDRTLISNKINSLIIGYGADGPQDYTRIMYESYADPAVGWRAGAKRILIILGDAIPHDDNLDEGVPGISPPVYGSTGGDPGRDEVMFTADDLDLQTVLQGMKDNNVVLLFVMGSGYGAIQHWTYWTGITGGGVYMLSDVTEIPTAIAELVGAQATHVDKLTLKAETGYEAWLTNVVPEEYTDIDIPPEGATKTFEITITVPLGTTPGIYKFHIIADADGASYGEQEVTITVPPSMVIPEVPLGTILASAAMFIGLLSYPGIQKIRRTPKLP